MQKGLRENLELLEAGESLTKPEKSIFALLKKAAEAHDPVVICRVAGGWVRDKLLGLDSDDLDFALENCSGLDFANHLKSFAELKIMKNPEQSQHLDSAKVRVFGTDIDMCQLRCDEYSEESRIPTIRVGTPCEDAIRRDFTVNALYFNVNTGRVEDETSGLADLAEGMLRTPIDPFMSFIDDPLRIMRAFRFGPRFGFTLDDVIFEAAKAAKDAFEKKIARPRMEKELSKSLGGPDPLKTVEYLLKSELFDVVFNHTHMWNLDPRPNGVIQLQLLDRVAYVCTRTREGEERYGLVLAAIFAPMLWDATVPDPAQRNKKISPLRCAIVRNMCASSEVYRVARKALKSAANVRTLKKEGQIDRVTVGKWLRKVGKDWRLTSCVLFDETMEQFFNDTLVGFVNEERMEGVWDLKPLVNGRQLASMHNVKPGPIMAKLVQQLIEWQLANPSGTVEDYEHIIVK